MDTNNTIYVVYLTTYSGVEGLPLYIGSTSLKRLSKGYHGSVSSREYKMLWDRALKREPNAFRTEVLSTHQTRLQALTAERIVQEERDVVSSPQYVNMAFAGVHPRNSGRGRPMSTRTREALRNANLGSSRSEETKARMRESAKQRKPVSEASKAKMRESAKTRKRVQHSEETKAKLSRIAKIRGPMSEETKAKLSSSLKRACETPEARLRLSRAGHTRWLDVQSS
jgi:hypothetical protein